VSRSSGFPPLEFNDLRAALGEVRWPLLPFSHVFFPSLLNRRTPQPFVTCRAFSPLIFFAPTVFVNLTRGRVSLRSPSTLCERSAGRAFPICEVVAAFLRPLAVSNLLPIVFRVLLLFLEGGSLFLQAPEGTSESKKFPLPLSAPPPIPSFFASPTPFPL